WILEDGRTFHMFIDRWSVRCDLIERRPLAERMRLSTVRCASAPEKAFSACASACITTLSTSIGSPIATALKSSSMAARSIVGSDAVLLSGQFITTIRPANAFKDVVAHQRLQHLFEMSRRQPKSPRQRLSLYRLVTRIERDIDDRGDRQNAFARQKVHG